MCVRACVRACVCVFFTPSQPGRLDQGEWTCKNTVGGKGVQKKKKEKKKKKKEEKKKKKKKKEEE